MVQFLLFITTLLVTALFFRGVPTSHLTVLFPSGVPSNQCSFDGEAVQGEALGIMTETAGALVTARFLHQHNVNLGIFH